uniref:Uncharacterized protein n=1 Tax=Romanomermis culicivorax TaxID=13658 RepID=A0A915J7X9_ROMCU
MEGTCKVSHVDVPEAKDQRNILRDSERSFISYASLSTKESLLNTVKATLGTTSMATPTMVNETASLVATRSLFLGMNIKSATEETTAAPVAHI